MAKPILLLVFLLSLASSSYALLSPAAPPRFDVFLDKIVKPWNSVEEVMRSCGGAVQGIRDDGHYLNRADDGFIYFDCGSYSHGPVSLSSDDEWRCSLSIPGGSSRILLIGTTNELKSATMLDKETSVGQEIITKKQDDFTITSQISCRMPSQSQLWNLQRVKWEKATSDAPNNDVSDDSSSQMAYKCWMHSSSDDTILSMGISGTHLVKEIVRTYTEEGQLVRVMSSTGIAAAME